MTNKKLRSLSFVCTVMFLIAMIISFMFAFSSTTANAATITNWVQVASVDTQEYIYNNNGDAVNNKSATRHGYRFKYKIQRSGNSTDICLGPASELLYVQTTGQIFKLNNSNTISISYSASNTVTETISNTITNELTLKVGASFKGLSAEASERVSNSVTSTYTSQYSSSFSETMTKCVSTETTYVGGEQGTYLGISYISTGYRFQVVITEIDITEEKSIDDCGWKWQNSGSTQVYPNWTVLDDYLPTSRALASGVIGLDVRSFTSISSYEEFVTNENKLR